LLNFESQTGKKLRLFVQHLVEQASRGLSAIAELLFVWSKARLGSLLWKAFRRGFCCQTFSIDEPFLSPNKQCQITEGNSKHWQHDSAYLLRCPVEDVCCLRFLWTLRSGVLSHH